MGDAWRPLRPTPQYRGHLCVCLVRDGTKCSRHVHRLVLEAFLGPCPPGLICCHNDGDPANNRLSNLRWDTYKSNSEDMLRHGTRRMGSAAGAKLDEEDVLGIRRLKAGGRPDGRSGRPLRRQPTQHRSHRLSQVVEASPVTGRWRRSQVPALRQRRASVPTRRAR